MKNTSNIKYLVDTNILIYYFDKTSPFHKKAKTLILDASEVGIDIFVAQQNLIEYTNVLSRLYQIPTASITDDIENIQKDIRIITPISTTLSLFLQVLKNSYKSGKRIFDLFLAATMLDNGINHIITANEKDFEGINGITAHNPWRE